MPVLMLVNFKEPYREPEPGNTANPWRTYDPNLVVISRIMRFDPNTEAGLVALKMADRNMTDTLGFDPPWAPPINESASRTLAMGDTCGISFCVGNPTFTIQAGMLRDGFIRAFIGQCTFTGSAVTIRDTRVGGGVGSLLTQGLGTDVFDLRTIPNPPAQLPGSTWPPNTFDD